MAGEYLGDFTTADTVYVYFNTFDSNDPSASVTLTGLAVTDIEIYKNGSAVQRSSDSGYTLLDTDGIDFDGITGIHGFSIDLSDNTDAGFYAAGNEYVVIVSSVTVDAAVVNFVAATFSIERNNKNRQDLAAILTDTADMQPKLGTPAGADISADIATVDSNVDAILVDTGTTLDNHLTDIKGTGFVKDTHSLTDIEAFVDLIDDGTSGLAKIATDAAAILADTGTDGVAIAASAIDSTKFAAGAIDAGALAADAVDEILDEQIGDGTLTVRESLRVAIAALAGKLSGAATTTITIRNDADTQNVIVATVDANGNRSAVTVTP